MDDPRAAAKLKLFDEILQFASQGAAQDLKARHAPAALSEDEGAESPSDEAAEPAPDDESLPSTSDSDPEDPTAGLSEEDLKKLLGA